MSLISTDEVTNGHAALPPICIELRFPALPGAYEVQTAASCGIAVAEVALIQYVHRGQANDQEVFPWHADEASCPKI